ncbi:hypothetical protein [Aeromonas veronii]|uniref:hypothetical protein n=1 Tax=Aeromonas veronii TaxID=654 RepID=UPI0002805FD6|nr:hypothetical protein [Aeromonas veronii]EKB09933.1 hypothetical protein HMPREF1167_03742 [Aeromonas veronii AER39]
MTQAKHNPVIQRGALLLSLLMAHGIAVAAPPSKNSDGIKISGDEIKINLDWDDKEYDWWQDNCLDLGIGDSRIKLNCDKMDGKYRDHYNRSIHSGNNPGQGHDKQKDKNKGNGKKN